MVTRPFIHKWCYSDINNLCTDSIHFKTLAFLAVYWSNWTSSYNTDIKFQQILNEASTMLNNVFTIRNEIKCICALTKVQREKKLHEGIIRNDYFTLAFNWWKTWFSISLTVRLGSAPLFNRILITSLWPYPAAPWIGVSPLRLVTLILAPWSSKYCTTFEWFLEKEYSQNNIASIFFKISTKTLSGLRKSKM